MEYNYFVIIEGDILIVYMVRHGQTDYNKKRIMQGISDIDLNSEGKRQAKEAKEKLKDVNFDICFSSPLARAYETAKIIVGNKCDILFNDLLTERDLGKFEGKNYEQYKKYDFWDIKSNSNYNGVETVKDLFIRTKKFLDELKNKDYNKVLIVSHHATIRALHFNMVGYDNDTDLLSFHPLNGEVYKYEI